MTLRGPFQPNSGTYTVIPGGTFESGMPSGGPNAPGLGTFVRSTQWGARGIASAVTQTLTNFNGNGYAYLTNTLIAVQPGSTYVVSGFFYAPTLLAGSALYIDLNDIVLDADTGLGSAVTHVGQPDVFFCWRLWTAPAGMTSVRPRLVHDGAAAAVGELGFIDDVAVTPLASFVPPVCAWVENQPAPQVSCVAGQAVFGVVGGGPSPFTYAWRKNTIPIDTVANPSAATATLSMTNVSAADVASYDCVVTNSCGSITSNSATLSICYADFNCDAVVEDGDFVVFAAAYDLLLCDDPAMPANCPADLNRDGLVEDSDFVLFASAYDALVCS